MAAYGTGVEHQLLIAAIGWSHLLQPPLTWHLASDRGLALKRSVCVKTEIAAGVLYNMGVASIALPTSLGLLLAHHAGELAPGTAAASLALVIAAFWTWRLYRQWRLRGVWPRHRMGSWWLLVGIFVVQGPVLGAVLAGVLL
jgi:hypothetical protein